MHKNFIKQLQDQERRNADLCSGARYLGQEHQVCTVPLCFNLQETESLSDQDLLVLEALQIDAARIALEAVAALAKMGEMDSLGGGLELIPPLLLTLLLTLPVHSHLLSLQISQ